jgi:hypothetical protein
MRKMTMLFVMMMLFGVLTVVAQTDTGTEATTEASSNVAIFAVICENQAVVNFNGEMEVGFDVYFQVFSGAQGAGTALTNIRQVPVEGTYAFSEAVPYVGGTVPAASTGSVRAFIAPEGRPGSPASDIFIVDDVQDGCNNPQNALGASTDTGTGGAGSLTSTATTTTHGVTRIRSPFGGFLNQGGIQATPEPAVVIGARQSVNPARSTTAGVLFAECDEWLPAAAPGVLYDNDNVVIFWAWYARTAEQVQDHIAKAQYDVRLNGQPLVNVNTTAIEKRGANQWVFYVANIGRLTPGGYGVQFNLRWSEAHFDGYREYGPGTSRETQSSTCTFRIERNPDNINVTDYNLSYSVR